MTIVEAQEEPHRWARQGGNWVGLALLSIAVLATLPVFWFGFEGLVQEWAKPAFQFKAVVPFVALLLFLQVLRTVPAPAGTDRTRWIGVVGVSASLAVAVFGNLIRIDDFVFVAIVCWIVSLVVAHFGLRRALLFWAPLATLVLMLPLPRFVLAPIQRALESMAAEVALGALRLLGIPATIDGHILDFGLYQVRIAEMMQVLTNFLPVMLVVFFFATFYRGPLCSRVTPLLLAGPVMVCLAASRILVLGLALDRGGVEAGERLLRATDDWVFFAFSVVVLLALVHVSRRIGTHESSGPGRLDLDVSSLASQVRGIGFVQAGAPLFAAAMVTAAVGAVFAIAPSRPAVAVEREDFRRFPSETGAWSGSRRVIQEATATVLNADDYVLIDFVHPDEATAVNFWAAYYHSQDRDEGGIHSPQDCIPLDGWNIVSFRPVDVALDGAATTSITLNRAVVEKGGAKALVYYWFKGRGRSVANEHVARLLVKFDGLVRGRTDGALVRYVTPILPGESEHDADGRLSRLLASTINQLTRFIPE